jgi:uncharacterized membrane protein
MTSTTLENPQDQQDRQANQRSKAEGGTNGHRINVGGAERWLSVASGAALALYGLRRRRSPAALALAAAGTALISRGATGHSRTYKRLGVDSADPNAVRHNMLAAVLPSRKLEVERAYTIMRPRAELFAFWRDLQNLPRFMEHLQSVTETGDGRSHWVTKAPIGESIEWDAEITEEVQDRLIAWRSLPGSAVENSGQVQFSEAPGGRGTLVRATIRYSAPGGKLGMAVARLFGQSASQQLREDLRRFKRVMEAGETPTIEGQPHGSPAEAKR